MNYELDKTSAASVAASTQITSTGAYDGTITQAVELHAKSGAVGIEFVFKAKSGESCFTQLWLGKEGYVYFGRKILDAIMVVLGVTSCASERGTYYNAKREKQTGDIFPSLCGKPIGLLLQRQERQYLGRNGDPQTTAQMNIVTPYDVATRKIAAELINGTEAKALEKKIATTHDIPAKPIPGIEKLEKQSIVPSVEDEALPF